MTSAWNQGIKPSKTQPFVEKSSNLPFGHNLPSLESISGPTYLTAQVLVQQVAYSLSDKLFTYSPDTFDLDIAARDWASSETANSNGYTTSVSAMQTRAGAASIALGYIFSKDFDLKKRHIPQSILASSSCLKYLREALDQLSLLYSVANPFVAHIAAADYAPGAHTGLVVDYISAMDIAEEIGLGLVSSSSAYEAQHMSLFATLLAGVLPTLHIYDGVHVGRDTVRVVDVLSQTGLKNTYDSVAKEFSAVGKRLDVDGKVVQLLQAFNNELGTAYEMFEYHGHSEAEVVLVVFGTVESSISKHVVTKLSEGDSKVGVINVRVYRPFVEEAFLKALPKSVRTIAVLGQVQNDQAVSDQSIQSSLYADVLAAISFSATFATAPAVRDMKYGREDFFSPSSMTAAFLSLAGKDIAGEARVQLLNSAQVQQYTFWNLDESVTTVAPLVVGKLLSGESASNNISVKREYDNLILGGTIRTDIRNSKKSIEASYSIEDADLVVVGDEKLFKDIDVLSGLKPQGNLLVKLPDFKAEDLEKRLPDHVRKDIQIRGIKLFIVDPAASPTTENNASAENLLIELAFLKVARPDLLEKNSLDRLSLVHANFDKRHEIYADLEEVLKAIEVPATWAEIEGGIPDLPTSIQGNSFAAFEKAESEEASRLRDWQVAAKGFAFKEAYGTATALRPDLPVKTFNITVQENRRLTPITYDRNIFHIEFDLGTSGLKYDIGEALGIHAENDPNEIEEFIDFYGLNPEDIVEVPSREDPEIWEARTVYQSLIQNIDIFGKPPKRFYEALAEFATDDNEKKELLTLGGPEGATEFKRRSEVDTITYADVLLEFKSAHPSFHDIARIVSPMKRREYSITSSQMVNPSTVALMIVVVSWVDPKGRDRFGQATRYLSRLPVGARVTASVKPSVMKLPAKDTAPLIMAGLGTGLAPFRAFVQHRALQKSQGKEIGAILLYMGSRHQREEYLYGEEWEAYQDAGVITLLGRAFSRDQPQKIYIQDRMRQTLDAIIQAYIKDEGSFYLCGPTWPVPDVTEVLEEAIAKEGKEAGRKVEATKEIERLKEGGRYVLEVY